MNRQRWKGTGVALVTAFTDSGSLDFHSLGQIIEFVLDGGVDYLVVLGTTGEASTLSAEEKKQVWQFVAQQVRGRVPLMAGLGGNHTEKVIDEIKKFSVPDYEAFLSVTPYYNKPTQEGLYQHYMALASISPLPIMLYNVPGRTAVNLMPETALRLHQASDRFIGIKEASGNLLQIMHLLQQRPPEFLVVSGDDALTVPMLCLGADGVISVTAQATPRLFSTMVRAGREGQWAEARRLHFQLYSLMDVLFREGNPVGIKAALHHLGFCQNHVRLPLVPASRALSDQIAHILNLVQESQSN